MSRNSKRHSSNRGSTGSEIARSTLKVFLSNGDSRSVKCGEATDIKVGEKAATLLSNLCHLFTNCTLTVGNLL